MVLIVCHKTRQPISPPIFQKRRAKQYLKQLVFLVNGENVFETSLPSKGLLVIGNEGRGISALTEQLLTRRLSIPKHPDGGAESLNAAVAAGILAALCYGGRSIGPVGR